MSVVFPNDYPKTRREAIAALASIRDEDIDYSDIPALTKEELERFKPVGNRFKEMGRRNMALINRLLKEYAEKLEKEEAIAAL